ncbi:MAG: ParB/RepB/Spo0J family partition protein [Planctomycetaceae bacterium]|nr:ParB/RepB/Spo0J family partition protein [Planctomycetaceae bacterium]
MPQEPLLQVPLERIVAEQQVREQFDESALAGLAASLREVGQLQPIRCRKRGEQYVIVDGERRFRAAKTAGLAALEVIVEADDLCAGEVLHRQLVANLQRVDLAPMERAQGMRQLMQFTGWNAGQVATHLGVSAATVTRSLAILSLPESLQQQIEAGELAPSAAYELSRIAEPERQTALAESLATGNLTRDGVAGIRKALSHRGTRVEGPRTARATAQLGEGRTVSVSGPNLDLESFISALEDVLSKARRARPQGVALRTFLKIIKDQSSDTATA